MKIFYSAILSVFILTYSIFAQDNARLSKTWEVQKYDITATLPQGEADRFLNAKAILTLKNVSSGSATSLTLRISPNAAVSAVKVNDAAADFNKSEEKIANGTLQKIGLRGLSIQSGGNVSVAVEYKLKVDENSGLNALSPVNSQFLPLSYWYPTPNSWYFARGADYAPTSLKVISSGGRTIISTGTENSGAFEQKLNVQPFFTTGSWDAVNASGVTVLMPKGVSADGRKRAEELGSLAAEIKTFMSGLLGVAPDVPLRIVGVRRGAGFSSGGTVFVENAIFDRQKLDSNVVMTLAETVAKIYFGGAANIRGDGDGVIREGLSKYLATQFIEQKYGQSITDTERLRQRTSYSAIAARDAPLTVVSPLDDFYYAEVANKGAMIWRLLAKKIGRDELFKNLRAVMQDGNLDLSEIRAAFPAQKEFFDYSFDQVTDMNLLVGLPQINGAETKINLRNTGSVEATVNITAATANGENLTAQTTIPAKSFGEVNFKTSAKILRTEIDKEKFYPQTQYSDDVAPKQFDDGDLLLAVKRGFDKQNFAEAEKNARIVLQNYPDFDDVRILLARSLLAENKTTEAEKEFRAVTDAKLPTARSLSWANEGLGEIAAKNNQSVEAVNFFNQAVKTDGEYGASLLARQGRNKIGANSGVDENIKQFFAKFDAAVLSNRKADVDALIVPGEVRRFAGGISGQAETWQTKIVSVDKTDENNYLVEAILNTKILSREPESGTVVFRLAKIGSELKINGIEVFEVK